MWWWWCRSTYTVVLVYKYMWSSHAEMRMIWTRWAHALYLLNYFTRCVLWCFRVSKQYSGTRHCEGFCIIFDLFRCHYGHATRHCVYIIAISIIIIFLNVFCSYVKVYILPYWKSSRERCLEKHIFDCYVEVYRAMKTVLFASYI